MARRIPEEDLRELEAAIQCHSGGASTSQISSSLRSQLPRRTLQHRLKFLVDSGRLVREGRGRWARYRVQPVATATGQPAGRSLPAAILARAEVPYSNDALAVLGYLNTPVEARQPTGFNRAFLDSYRPNESSYLSAAQRRELEELSGLHGTPGDIPGLGAGGRSDPFLIDLTWNCCRLSGNTYSLRETVRLVAFGEEADGRLRAETQMVLNHRDAIEFLVESAVRTGPNLQDVLNLHAFLSDNLLNDPDAEGSLRRRPVLIAGSAYLPETVPHVVGESMRRLLAIAAAIHHPFEQALFVMAQLAYLQPFAGLNEPLSRLAANIPLIASRLPPLTFEDVSPEAYSSALLGVYEFNRIEPLRDLFVWAYGRSVARLGTVRQTAGEPHPFRMRHRHRLREVAAEAVRGLMNRSQAAAHVEGWALANIDPHERAGFQEMAEQDLTGMHAGNFARARITLSEFAAWRKTWNREPS